MVEICALLVYYPSYSGSSLPLGCSETSVRNCHCTMDNILDECQSSPIKFLVTQFSSSYSYSDPSNSSIQSLNLCKFSGFHSSAVDKNSGRLRHEAVFRRWFGALQPLDSVSSSQRVHSALASNPIATEHMHTLSCLTPF
jgi:hypothetical protein